MARRHQRWRDLDAIRRAQDPVAAALVQSLIDGRIARRDFLRRGVIIGMTAPTLAAVAAACTSDDPGPGSRPGATTPGGGSGVERRTRLVVGVARGDANSGLDPVNMAEAGTFAVVAQCFEYLVGTDADGAIASTGLAERWSPNSDGSVWTFVLRNGPRWVDGSLLTADDVAATLDRLVAAGNVALVDVLGEGSVDAVDARTAVVTLREPSGNLPVLLSASNPQSVITPADYSNGTTLDERIDGTGAWTLESFEAPEFVATYRRNRGWWGSNVRAADGTTESLPDTLEVRGFPDPAALVEAMQNRDIDVVAQFTANGGRALLDDPTIRIIGTPSSAHRQIWFNTQRGLFVDRRLRQAVAWAVERELVVGDVSLGHGVVGNDHPVRGDLASMPFFDPTSIGQRLNDFDRAGGLVSDTGAGELSTTLHTNELPEATVLAEMVAASIGQIGIRVDVERESSDTFYRDTWCPLDESARRCQGSADFGIVEVEHHALPDIALGRAFVSGGAWNASNYSNPDLDRLFRQYQQSIDLEDQRRAVGQIQAILWNDVPAVIPSFDDILTAHDPALTGVQVLASGQPVVSGAAWT
jgi:peptide/nickel transport system substrate-binding protein